MVRSSGSLLLAALMTVGAEAQLSKCGIVASVGECAKDKQYLESLDEATASQMNCMGYGGEADQCTLSITNDADAGMSKDPTNCKVLYLWDEPYTQAERGHPEWANNDYIVKQWQDYATKWSSQLKAMRANGGVVTSPLFTDLNVALDKQVDDFFNACSGCNDQGSDQYIDAIAFNAWIGDWNPTIQDGANWIKGKAGEFKQKHDNRPVVLGNYAYIGADATTDKQVDVIKTSGMYDADSGVDSVLYFAAKDYGGGIPDGSNYLDAKTSEGSTIGQELINKCAGGDPDEEDEEDNEDADPTPVPEEETTLAPDDETTTQSPETTTTPVLTTEEQTTTLEPTTTSAATTMKPPTPPYPGDKACRACQTMCSPCKACTDSQEGECSRCWRCWDWDDNELEDDDAMDEDCDALDEDHDWDDDEVRCLTNDMSSTSSVGADGRRRMFPNPSTTPMDCRACWSGAPRTPLPPTPLSV